MSEAFPIQMQTIGQMLRHASTVWLGSHVNPDGDAIGSLLGLGHVLQQQGKQVCLFCPSPIPERFGFLSGATDIVFELPDWEPDLIAILDCGDLDRLGYLHDSHLFQRVPTANIDHHATNTRFAKVNWVDPTMAATTEMLATLIQDQGWPIDATAAMCLLAGLHTDSLGFRTNSTRPRTLHLAADLMAAGASMTTIVDRVYDSKPRAALRIWGAALANLREDGPLVWAAVTNEMLGRTGAENGYLNGIVGFMRSTADVEVAVLFSETPEGRVRVEFRSKGRVNVAETAQRLGGGGHVAASGCSQPGPLEEAERIVLAEVRQDLAAAGF
ncbi:MAG: bifunctional oligoribonuclease/PAP phosphatase NrnA [Chloroflexi bacterium]|nr:bifunctional oligoribonuclease/PAP phosphatase NrnA [Chloroflexota bacterium]MBU1747036.1 bifunctional oligoribonuclease/PAP phosphatase NrnA [Chloroflexota bacterium]